ncbi:hypothetical protein KI387_037676, partial [Taxus chinensis]
HRVHFLHRAAARGAERGRVGVHADFFAVTGGPPTRAATWASRTSQFPSSQWNSTLTWTASFHDPDGNHVGVDINNVCSVWTRPAGYWNLAAEFQTIELASGRIIQAWIDYDHPTTQLNVSLMYAGFPKPETPLICMDIDLSVAMGRRDV